MQLFGTLRAAATDRREFIGLVGAGAAATLLGSPAWGAFELPADELQSWRRDLFAPAKPRLYYSDKHTDARTGVIRKAGVFSYDGSSPGLAAKLADFVRRRCRTRSSSSPMSVHAAWTESRSPAVASGPNSTGTPTKRHSP